MNNQHRITVISAGPGGKDYITDSARAKAKECEIIIGSAEQLEAIEIAEGQTSLEEWGIENIMSLLERYRGQKVGILVTGDAGIYSLAQRITDRYGKDSITEIIPGISSLQVAFARIKEPWLNVRVFSYREAPFEGLEEILSHERAAVFCDKNHNSQAVLTELEKVGLFRERRQIYVCQELTLKNEKVIEIETPEAIKALEVKQREIVIIINLQERRLS